MMMIMMIIIIIIIIIIINCTRSGITNRMSCDKNITNSNRQ